jgi:hypothetical protein
MDITCWTSLSLALCMERSDCTTDNIAVMRSNHLYDCQLQEIPCGGPESGPTYKLVSCYSEGACRIPVAVYRPKIVCQPGIFEPRLIIDPILFIVILLVVIGDGFIGRGGSGFRAWCSLVGRALGRLHIGVIRFRRHAGRMELQPKGYRLEATWIGFACGAVGGVGREVGCSVSAAKLRCDVDVAPAPSPEALGTSSASPKLFARLGQSIAFSLQFVHHPFYDPGGLKCSNSAVPHTSADVDLARLWIGVYKDGKITFPSRRELAEPSPEDPTASAPMPRHTNRRISSQEKLLFAMCPK